eukprot:jgi/Hompol1/1677/HPOL_004883-RA
MQAQILRGDRIIQSDIAIHTLLEASCVPMCFKPVHQLDVRIARRMIRDQYNVEWILDGLPSATAKLAIGGMSATPEKRYEIGFPLGQFSERIGTYELFNHVLINIIYRLIRSRRGMLVIIVGFEIYPKSLSALLGFVSSVNSLQVCRTSQTNPDHAEPFYLPESGHVTIPWSYSVRWQQDQTIDWEHRWDLYLDHENMGSSIHWQSVISSIVILILLTAAIAIQLWRTLNYEIVASNGFEIEKLGLAAPFMIMVVMLIANHFVWLEGSSYALPFGTIVAFFAVWFCVSIPCVYLGARAGSKTKMEFPTAQTHAYSGTAPAQPWFLATHNAIIISGLFPFTVGFIEIYSILDALWNARHIHHLFGFLCIIALLLVLTSIEVTIVTVYFSLRSEDPRWQWRSFLIGGASTFHIFAYITMYFLHNLNT